jgi:hypothetical protein
MKRLLIALTVLLLNGCAVYDAYMMTGFDGNEYQLITQIRVDAGKFKNQCGDVTASVSNANTLAYETQMFESYSQYIPNNKDTYAASKSLNEIAQGLVARYKQPTPVPLIFCKLKFEGIEHSAETMQTVIGKRPR